MVGQISLLSMVTLPDSRRAGSLARWQTPPAMTTPVIRLDKVVKSYGSVVALNGLTADIPPGVIGLVGANGAGKTTLFRILLGLIAPSAGRVEVAGIDVASQPLVVRQHVGYMPEHECLPGDQTAADLVSSLAELSGLPRRQARTRASEVLDLVGIDEERFRPIAGFSTGMKQRTKLAQAVAADPRLVLLDEPTNGLDPSGRYDMLALVRRLGDFGVSVVMATHILDDVQRTCDYVLMIDAGNQVAAGSTADLMAGDQGVVIEIDGPVDAVVSALAEAGLQCDEVGRRVEIAPGEGVLDTVRDVLAELEAPLVRLGGRGASLDEVFRREAARR
jgi:ABC-2 type transport system ATP-binding protein